MNTRTEGERSDIEDLLPWHAAGTLGHGDMQRVETALANDPELARRYELVREELGQTIHLNETLGAPSPRAMAALFAKIDAEPARSRSVAINFGASIRKFFGALSPRTLAWSATAAALAIVLQTGFIVRFIVKEKNAGSYETASVSTNAADNGDYALIRFQPQATAADITNFLEANKLNVSEGPTAGGLYRVRIAATKLPRTELDRLIKKQGRRLHRRRRLTGMRSPPISCTSAMRGRADRPSLNGNSRLNTARAGPSLGAYMACAQQSGRRFWSQTRAHLQNGAVSGRLTGTRSA